MPTIGVVIGTYGDLAKWTPLAERALASVDAQTRPADEVVWNHDDTLAAARNFGAGRCSSDWLVFLDADDELDSGYLEAMEEAVTEHGPADRLFQPSTLGVQPDGTEDDAPVLIAPRRTLLDGNHMVIGTMVRRQQFERVEGFDDWPMLEDWACFLKCWVDGAQLAAAPDAVYRVHVNPAGRNAPHGVHAKTYRLIRRKYERLARERGLVT